MNDNNQKPESLPTPEGQQRAQRRKLLKRGALLVPAVLTLHARPAMAATGTNTYGYGNYVLNSNGDVISGGKVFYTKQEANSASDPGAQPWP